MEFFYYQAAVSPRGDIRLPLTFHHLITRVGLSTSISKTNFLLDGLWGAGVSFFNN